MALLDEPTLARVVSRDGTDLGVWTSGDGPPLVLVHGAPADHTRWRPLLPHLEPRTRVHALDRRGRGASGDGSDYDLTREFEDVAAVIDAVADASASTVDLYGHSFGGLCAFGGATLTPNVRRLVLYEGWPLPDPAQLALPGETNARIDALLAAGELEAILETVFREVVGASEAEIRELRAQPSWQARVAAAHQFPRELQACAGPQAALDPVQAQRITAPTLLVAGEHSGEATAAAISTVAASLPASDMLILADHGHVADILAPDTFAEHLLTFLRS